MSEPAPRGRVRQIGVADLKRLGLDDDRQLYWDGQRIEIRRPLTLTSFQKALTAVVSICAVLGGLGGFVTGLNNATVFLCARGVDWLSCPPPPPLPWPAPSPAPNHP